MNIEKLFEEFVVAKRAEGIKRATVIWYTHQITTFINWLATQNGQEVGPATVRRYLVYLRDRHEIEPGMPALAEASIAGAHRALNSFFKWCQDAEEISEVKVSPMLGVKLKRPEPVEPRRALRSEVDTLLRAIPVDGWQGLRDYLIVHVIFFCGLRVGELVRLEEHHFDVESQILHVPGGKTGAGVVPLVRDVIEAFLSYQMHRPTGATDKLLVSATGQGNPKGAITPAGVRQMIERRCKEAGLRHLSPHSFRHGIAMHLLNDKRVDATMVQRILRHQNLRTTTTYYAQWTLAALIDEYRNVIEG